MIKDFLYPQPKILNPNTGTKLFQKDNLKEKSVMVIDNGIFFGLAQRLARDFGKVYYYTDYNEEFLTIEQVLIGAGFEDVNIVKVKDVFEVDADLYVFPNSNHEALQARLISMNKNVFGSRYGAQLEGDRWFGVKTVKECGLPIPNVARINGVDNLIAFLADKEDKWIKISHYRGVGETWHYTNMDECQDYLNKLKYELGAINTIFEFLVFDAIDAEVETGFDGIFIDDQFSNIVSLGFEIKDLLYVAKYIKYQDLPEIVKIVGNKVNPALKQFGYRNFFSTEERITKNKIPYFTDWTCRSASPAGELFYENISNISEAIWYGAQGLHIELQAQFLYGVQGNIISDYGCTNWMNVEFPDDIQQYVKLRNCCKIDNKIYCIPQPYEYPELGTVLGFGNTLQEAAEQCVSHASQVKGFQIEVRCDALEEALKQIELAKAYGINF
jgi:hypothetical protein